MRVFVVSSVRNFRILFILKRAPKALLHTLLTCLFIVIHSSNQAPRSRNEEADLISDRPTLILSILTLDIVDDEIL